MELAECEPGPSSSSSHNKNGRKPRPPLVNYGYVFQIYPILNIVFSYLDDGDLRRACLVCKEWYQTAYRVIKKRAKVSWVGISMDYETDEVTHHNSPNFHKSSGAKLILFAAANEKNKMVQASQQVLIEHFLSHDLMSWVKFCMLPCENIQLGMDGTIAKGLSLGGLLIPHIPNVRLSIHYCNVQSGLAGILSTIAISTKKNEKMKCILIFTVGSAGIYEAQLWNRKEVAVGGGVLKKIKELKKGAYGIAFYETKASESDFDAYSVVIHQSMVFEDKLVEFRKAVKLREHRFAIKIVCCAKPEAECETEIFTRVFPNTVVIGCEADGEFGWDLFGDYGDRLDFVISHSFSTSIVLITWGKPVLET